jgi:hypothetical protein
MVGENRNTAFEHWLAAYGSHLEELTGARLSGAGQSEPAVGDAPDPQNGAYQKD